MPVHIRDKDLEEDRDGRRHRMLSPYAASSPAADAVGPTEAAGAAGASAAVTSAASAERGSLGAASEEPVDASAAGGKTGVKALIRILIRRLSVTARAGQGPARLEPRGPEGDASAFDSELRTLLEGGPLNSGPLGQSLGLFSAVYLFHMQREFHAATLRPAGHPA